MLVCERGLNLKRQEAIDRQRSGVFVVERGCSFSPFWLIAMGMACRTLLTLFILLLLPCDTFLVNIHRAVPRVSKGQRDTSDPQWFVSDLSRIFAKREAWLYTIPATVLVGMCGIFPLLVIPVEAGQALREGVTADNLKLLLSFAVGGLLGDVFLHLLPEAYSRINQADPQSSYQIGLWIIAGLIGFLILEKSFGEQSEEEEESSSEKTPKQQSDKSATTRNGIITSGQSTTEAEQECHDNLLLQNGYFNSESEMQCRQRHQEESKEDKSQECSRTDLSTDQKKQKPQENIKVIGYLNLFANCVDNFTHGLAVAGSFSVSTKVGICTTCAILLHEIPHEIGDFAILLKSGFRRWDAAVGQVVTASVGLAGAVTGLVVDHAGDSTAMILPFTSGGFIYIALVTIVPELLEEKRPWESLKQVLLVIAGVGIMGLVSLLH